MEYEIRKTIGHFLTLLLQITIIAIPIIYLKEKYSLKIISQGLAKI